MKLLLPCLFAAALCAQVATEANKGYTTETGRAGLARGLDGRDRDARQRPQELIDSLGLKPGMTVADIGTGAGYMLPFLSRAVGSTGHVIAEDIFDDFLAKAKQKIRDTALTNAEVVKGTETDPALAANTVDVVFTLDSYHHYDYPEKMLAGFHKGLRPGGRLVVAEYYKNKTSMPNGRALTHVRLDKPDVIKEVEANGFKLLSQHDHIKDGQYVLIFAR